MREDVESGAEEALRRSRRHFLYALLLFLAGLMAYVAPQYKVVTVTWAGLIGALILSQLSLWACSTASETRALRQVARDMHIAILNLPQVESLGIGVAKEACALLD